MEIKYGYYINNQLILAKQLALYFNGLKKDANNNKTKNSKTKQNLNKN